MTVDFDAQFNELREDYLFAIADSVRSVEELLVQEQINKESIKEIFRQVHSMKGGAASHELPIISTICHHFEEYIASHMKETDRDDESIDICLSFIDLISKCSQEYKDQAQPRLDIYQDKLASLRTFEVSQKMSKGKVLLAEGTSTMARIIRKGLEVQGYSCVVTKNGLSAFNRIIVEKFDAIITSLNIEQLDGVSLISAIKSTNNINSNIPTIIISASTNIADRFPKAYQPNAIIFKDTTLMQNLSTKLESILSATDLSEINFSFGPERILYVEDDPRMQKLFKLAMKKHSNVELAFATNLEEALSQCENFKPDLLLLDNFLEGCSGKDIFEQTHKLNIPAIFLTASEGSVDTKSLNKHREYLGIIAKPFRPAAIYGQICRFYKDR